MMSEQFVKMSAFWRVVMGGVLIVVLAACGTTPTDEQGADAAAQVVERYLTAKAASDETTIRALLCSTMEDQARREAGSFASVETTVEGLACAARDDQNVVQCEGEIVAVYGTENRSFPFTRYDVVEEDGEWKWCGMAE